MQRINECFRASDGTAQANFLLSLLECYGADAGERLPLGVFLPWLIFYATRCADDAHWGTVSYTHLTLPTILLV